MLLCSMLLVSLFIISDTEKLIISNLEEKLHVVNDLKKEKISSFHNEVSKMLEHVQRDHKTNLDHILKLERRDGQDSVVQAFIVTKKEDMTERLDNIRKTFSNFNRIMIFRPNGELMVSARTSSEAYKTNDKKLYNTNNEFFNRAKTGKVFSDILQAETEQGESYMAAMAPIENTRGQLLAILSCEVDLKSVYHGINDTIGLGTTGETILTKRVGNEVHFISKPKKLEGNFLKHKYNFLDQSDTAWACKRSVDPQSQHGFESKIIDYKYDIVDAAWDYIPGVEWGIVSKIDHKESFKKLDEFKRKVQLICFGIIFLAVIVITIFVQRFLTPIINIRNNMVALAVGKFPENIDYVNQDEIRETINALNHLVKRLRTSTDFAERIGKGDLNARFEGKQSQDVLSKSLISMQESLAKIEEENQRRKWLTEGIALHGEVLRRNTEDIGSLGEALITSLVKYVDAHHGGLYAVNYESQGELGEENLSKRYFELIATYAYEITDDSKRKFLPGQGLIGQCALERETIYMENTPIEFTNITSGLGQFTALHVLIVPLKVNEEVYGVLELASFSAFEAYKIDFVEKLGESIASAILAVRSAEKTTDSISKFKEYTLVLQKSEKALRKKLSNAEKTIKKLSPDSEDSTEKDNSDEE